MSQNLWTAFIAANGSNEILVNSTDGNTWTGSRFINQWSPFRPALAYINGSLYVAFITNDVAVSGTSSIPSNRIFVCSTSDGVTWTPATFFNRHSKCAPALAAWGDNLYLAYISNDATNRILVCSYSQQNGWGLDTDTGHKSPQPPSLAQFGHDLYLAFVSNDGKNSVLISSVAPGGGWGSAVDTGQSCKFSPSLAVYGTNLYVGFTANNNSQTVFVCSSQNWSNDVSINQTSSAGPNLASFNDNLQVAFIADSTSQECLLTYSSAPTDSTKWLAQDIDMKQQSNAGASLAVAPFACWSEMEPGRQGGLSGSANYFIWGGSCSPVVNLTDLKLTIAISTALDSTDGFSFQWNFYTPEGTEAPTALSETFQQYGFLVDTNGNLTGWIDNWPSQPLRNKIYPAGSKAQQGSDLINDYWPMTKLPSPTLPAGYTLEIQLQNDPNTGVITGGIWTVYNNGVQIAQTSKTLDQETISNDRSQTVSADWLAPVVAFQVNLVGQANSATADFVSGQGTISVSSSTLMTADNNQPTCTSAQNTGTGEQGDSLYSQLPSGSSKLMVQPFSFG